VPHVLDHRLAQRRRDDERPDALELHRIRDLLPVRVEIAEFPP